MAFAYVKDRDNSIVPNNDYSKNSTFVGKTQENNGIKVTIQEMVYDGEDIYMSYKIESEKPFGYKTTSYPVNYEIDPVESTVIITKNTEYETKEINKMWVGPKNSVDYSESELYSYNWVEGMIIRL